MNVQQRAGGFARLGIAISNFLQGKENNSPIGPAIIKSTRENGWFTEENVRHALSSVAGMMTEKKISSFLSNYSHLAPSDNGIKGNSRPPKSVGVIMPSNIPLAGFHDFFCVLISGNNFVGKCAEQDKVLLPSLAEILITTEPSYKTNIRFTSGFQAPNSKSEEDGPFSGFSGLDAVIATGSNNSSRYFEYYFAKKPHIIRKNRNSVAVLSGKEGREDLIRLSEDIFRYFGLGCRNVSKIFMPEKYDPAFFLDSIGHWKEIINHNKFANNYHFNRTMFMMDRVKFLDNGFLLMKEDGRLSSPVSVLHYEFYKDSDQLMGLLTERQDEIQCIVSQNLYNPVFFGPEAQKPPGHAGSLQFVPFGQAQSPGLSDFADRVDTMKFLSSL